MRHSFKVIQIGTPTRMIEKDNKAMIRRSEIEESNRHSREFWKLCARVNSGGEVFEQNGLSIANAKQPWFFLNVAMLNTPIVDQAGLQRSAQEALAHFQLEKNPWVLTASEDWFGPNSEPVLSGIGLVRKLDLIGMAAERLSLQGDLCRPWSSGALAMRRLDSLSPISMQTLTGFRGTGAGKHWARLHSGAGHYSDESRMSVAKPLPAPLPCRSRMRSTWDGSRLRKRIGGQDSPSW